MRIGPTKTKTDENAVKLLMKMANDTKMSAIQNVQHYKNAPNMLLSGQELVSSCPETLF